MESVLKKQRCDDENINALKSRYAQFCEHGIFCFHAFTNDRHSVAVHVQRIKKHFGHVIVAEINEDLLILEKDWILGVFGFKDFKMIMSQIIDRAKKVKGCVHCSKLCIDNLCTKCQHFMVAPLYKDCSACQTDDHPIAWLCLTCIDSCYCTLCSDKMQERSKDGIIICPTCKTPNETTIDLDTIIQIDDEEDEERTNIVINPTERILNFIAYCCDRGEGRAILRPDTLLELSDLTQEELVGICKELVTNGYKTYLSTDTPWCMCIVLDDSENEIPPIINSVVFQP
jgi:hypothetical protein